MNYIKLRIIVSCCMKSVQIRSYFWFVFSCIQSKYRKIRTRNNSVFGHISRSANIKFFQWVKLDKDKIPYSSNKQKQQKKNKHYKHLDFSWFALFVFAEFLVTPKKKIKVFALPPSKLHFRQGRSYWKRADGSRDTTPLFPGIVACTCNRATLEAEFWNGVGSIPVGGKIPSIDGWVVWPPVIQH